MWSHFIGIRMLPTTSVDSRTQGNGTLSSRDAARHTAGAKRYKYLRRIVHFRHMDFEFALWQMLYLFTSPQKVYRNFQYRKQTKDQWARDDPAFLVILSVWLCGKCCYRSMGCVLILQGFNHLTFTCLGSPVTPIATCSIKVHGGFLKNQTRSIWTNILFLCCYVICQG